MRRTHLDRQPSRQARGDGADLIHPETRALSVGDHAHGGAFVLAAKVLGWRRWGELARFFHEPKALDQRRRFGCTANPIEKFEFFGGGLC